MAPKKKSNKKNDDWDADLGEAVDPIAAAAQAAKEAEAAQDGEEETGGGAGGLLASLRKNKGKRAKKGKTVDDFVEGEDPDTEPVNGLNGDAAAIQDEALAAKAPEEANMEDEDIYDLPVKKGKGGKGGKGSKQQTSTASEEVSRTASPATAAVSSPQPVEDDDDDEDDEGDNGGKVLSKKEKEKLKKEREKQRKKENVSPLTRTVHSCMLC